MVIDFDIPPAPKCPEPSYNYYFKCEDCDVKWHDKYKISQCWVCGEERGCI